MKVHYQDGEILDYANSSGSKISGGDVVVIGGRIGVAIGDIADGSTGEVLMEDVVFLPKASGAISQGDRLYWDTGASPKCLTKTQKTVFAGMAAYDAASGDAKAYVKLQEVAIPQSATVAAIATADGSDAGTTQTLANATKATVNSILTALKAAGLMA